MSSLCLCLLVYPLGDLVNIHVYLCAEEKYVCVYTNTCIHVCMHDYINVYVYMCLMKLLKQQVPVIVWTAMLESTRMRLVHLYIVFICIMCVEEEIPVQVGIICVEETKLLLFIHHSVYII